MMVNKSHLVIIIHPLCIQNIVHCDRLLLGHDPGARPPELLHLTAAPEHQPEVNTDGPGIEAGLYRDPENAHVPLVVMLQQLALVDCAYSELSLDSTDQWRSLE